jgi:hypothetical protein
MRTVLIVANQTLLSPSLAAAVEERIRDGPVRFHVVVPATPVTHLLSWDEKETAEAAQSRLDALLGRLEGLGAPSTGEIGLSDPVAAVADVVAQKPVDEIILSTLPPGISRWLGQDVGSRLQAKATVPVVVVTVPREAAAEV